MFEQTQEICGVPVRFKFLTAPNDRYMTSLVQHIEREVKAQAARGTEVVGAYATAAEIHYDLRTKAPEPKP